MFLWAGISQFWLCCRLSCICISCQKHPRPKIHCHAQGCFPACWSDWLRLHTCLSSQSFRWPSCSWTPPPWLSKYDRPPSHPQLQSPTSATLALSFPGRYHGNTAIWPAGTIRRRGSCSWWMTANLKVSGLLADIYQVPTGLRGHPFYNVLCVGIGRKYW